MRPAVGQALPSVMKSFRRLPDTDETRLSPQLASQTRAALVRREVALELKAAVGEPALKFALRAAANENAAETAARVRQELGITLADQTGWSDERSAYKVW